MVAPLKIQNIIAHTNLGKELNLLELASKVPGARYHSTGEHPVIRLHIDQPHSDALIFGNGKAVCSGTKTLAHAREAMSQVKRAIKAADKGVDGRAGVKVENVVASLELGTPFDLPQVGSLLGWEGVEYNPATFQGLIFRVEKPKATYLLFDSGVLTISDVESESAAARAAKRFTDFLMKADLLEREALV